MNAVTSVRPVEPLRAGPVRLRAGSRFRQGHPFGLVTFCTEPIFCYESKRAVSRVRFEPKYESGVPVMRTDVVYPLEYTLSDYDPATGEHVAKPFRTDKPQRPCREVPVS